jgi:hypothetical protein
MLRALLEFARLIFLKIRRIESQDCAIAPMISDTKGKIKKAFLKGKDLRHSGQAH